MTLAITRLNDFGDLATGWLNDRGD